MNNCAMMIMYYRQVKQLCQLETYIYDLGRAITEEDIPRCPYLLELEKIQEWHRFGWYIYDCNCSEQLKGINELKVVILAKMIDLEKL